MSRSHTRTHASISTTALTSNVSLAGIFDRDRSGAINFQEFGALWKYVTDWQTTFKSYDRDNSGSIDRNELKTGEAVEPSRLMIIIIVRHLCSADQLWVSLVRPAVRAPRCQV